LIEDEDGDQQRLEKKARDPRPNRQHGALQTDETDGFGKYHRKTQQGYSDRHGEDVPLVDGRHVLDKYERSKHGACIAKEQQKDQCD
jgi:hypothetical protein